MDYKELRRLAEKVMHTHPQSMLARGVYADFHAAASPSVVLALLEEIEALRTKLSRITSPGVISNRGNSISLNCKRSTIDLFVTRAIANKDVPLPTEEQRAQFQAALAAALASPQPEKEQG